MHELVGVFVGEFLARGQLLLNELVDAVLPRVSVYCGTILADCMITRLLSIGRRDPAALRIQDLWHFFHGNDFARPVKFGSRAVEDAISKERCVVLTHWLSREHSVADIARIIGQESVLTGTFVVLSEGLVVKHIKKLVEVLGLLNGLYETPRVFTDKLSLPSQRVEFSIVRNVWNSGAKKQS